MSYGYQWQLVAFSVFIAIFAAYTTLRLALRLAWAQSTDRIYWIAGGAISLGIGIWAMHFVGMLALHLPVPVAYDPLITTFSLLPAVLASAVALYVLSRPQAGVSTRFLASLLMGAGIVTMHYSGMEAMKMSPPIVYDPYRFMLSALIAVGASWGALLLVFRERDEAGLSFWRRLGGAAAMGLAIAGMHYMGMAAAEFAPGAVCTVAGSGLSGDAIGLFVGLVAVLVLTVSLALTFYDEVAGENGFYRALLRAQSDAGEGVLLIERGRIVYANPAMAALSGYTDAELKGLADWRVLADAEVPPLPTVEGTPATAAGGAGRFELVLRTRGGERRTCEAVLTGFRHAESVRHLLVCIDISARKAAEDTLRAREAQARELALVAARTDNAVIITDAQGLILWVNQGFEKTTGYTLAEVLGKQPGRLLQGVDSDPEVRRRMREHLDRGEGFEAEILNYHKSGRPYWLALDVKPVHDDSGRLVKFIAIERDITQSKLAEDALRQSAARLREAQQLAHVGHWELDLASNEYLLSDEALRIHEFDPGQPRVPREAVVALIHPDDLAENRRLRAEALARLGSYGMQMRLRMRDGRIRFVQLRAAVQADTHGNPVRIVGALQDVTEQKLAEQTLREREAQARELALVASSTDNGVIIMDADTRITWVNDGFTRMSGYTLDEVRGRRPSELLNGPETDVSTYAFIQERISRGERFGAELVHYHKSGRKYWAVIDVQSVYDEAGQLAKYISIERDITQNKLAEEALRQSEALLQEAQHLARIGSWELDLVTNEYRLSEEALRIHELESSDGRVSREAMAATLPSEEAAELRRARLAAMYPGGTYSARVRLVFAEGRTKYVQVRGAVHCDDRGQPVRVLGTVQDLTEQALAELALRASEARLKEAQRLAKIGHWEFDFASDDYLMSEEALRIHELESADGRVPRANVAAMIHPEDRELLRERRNVALANCSNFEVVMRLMFPDGRMKYAHLRGAVHCNEQGEPVRVGGTLQDVTEQKQAELALRELNETLEQRVLARTQELSQSLASLRETQAQLVQSEKMASLGGLVAGISHEINTPLGIGVTSATTLQEEFRSLRRAFEDNTLKRSMLERFISHGLNGCDILVNNLLRAAELIRSFKQVAVDQSSDDWRVINLHEYIDEIIVSLKPRLKSSRVQVLNESNGQLVLRTHPGAIYQILSNLVLNALIHAYAPDQPGTIRIRAEQVGQDIELDVADDGKGIPADIQDRIFDPFFTTRRGTGGSGLGLHIVFNLVSGTLAGGIHLDKNAGQGATFRIRFPVQSQSEDA